MRLDKAELSWEWPVQPLMVLALAAALFVTAQPLFCQTGAHIVTDLEVAPDNFDFLLAPNGDLYAIKKRNTTQHKTEVHVLTAASGYMHRGLEVATALEEASDRFQCLLGPEKDIYAVKTRNTTSDKTEVHTLSALTNYSSFGVTTCAEGPDGGCGVLHKDITRQCCPPNQHPEFSCASCGPAILVNSCLKPTSSCQLGPPVTQPPHSVISSPPNPSGCGQEPVRNAQPSENCYKRVAPSCWNEVSCGGPHPGLRPSYCYDYYTPVNHYCRRECESSYVVCGR